MTNLFALNETWATVELSSNGDYDYMAHTPMIDVSYWQGNMDFEIAASQGIRAVCIRATVGDYYTDPRFLENWDKARSAGLLVSAYHVIAPALDGVFISPEAQINNFLNALNDRKPDFPLVMDCELTRDQGVETITNTIKKCCDLVEDAYDTPMIYTAKYWWESNVARRQYWSNYPLWVAHYTDADEPLLPADWISWAVWQYTSKGDGATYGAESKSIDLNRIYDPEFLNINPQPPEPEEPKMTYEEFLKLNAQYGVVTTANVEYIMADIPDAPTDPVDPPIDPPPEPEPYQMLEVKPENPDKDVANCWFAKGENAAGKPIMEIYPSNSSSVSERIQIPRGNEVKAEPNKFQADGGMYFWELQEYAGRDGEVLSLRQVDVVKVE